MINTIEKNLELKGYKLPILNANAGLFLPYTIFERQIYVSGQLPLGFNSLEDNKGRLGENINIEQGKQIAAYCALNLLAQAKSACGGNLDLVGQCLKITVFVNSSPDFTDQPLIANAASEIINIAFGSLGHARSAIGVNQLPLGVAVEVEGIFSLLN